MTIDTVDLDRRRHLLMQWTREANAPRFSAEGEWLAGGQIPGIREREWHCLSLYEGSCRHISLANRILETSIDDGNDFSAFFAPLLLRLHGDKLSPGARQLLESSFAAILPHACEHLFRYTENCGLLNTFGLLEAAAIQERPDYRERALKYLRMFAHFLRENGVCREYFSLNYLPVTLFAAGTLRWLARDAEVRILAEQIEHHLWNELALCWHPVLHHPAAPSGRSYTVNSMGGYSGLHCLAWLGFGEAASPSPAKLGVFTSAEACASQDAVLPFMQAHLGIYASIRYNPPPDALELALNKALPFTYQTTTTLSAYRGYEQRSDVTEAEAKQMGGWYARGAAGGGTAHLPTAVLFPRGRTHLFGYMDKSCGLGTATQQMTGQSDTCHAVWRRGSGRNGLEDLRTLYLRYTIDDALEQCFDQPEYGGNLAEQGRGGALQSGPLAVCWYAAGEEILRGISSLRTCVMVSEWFGPVEEVWLGESHCPHRRGSSTKAQWVFLRDGESFVGIHPLVSRIHGDQPLLTVRPIGRFLCLTIANYNGPARDFEPAELRQTGGGAVICMGSLDRFRNGFSQFRSSCQAATILDSTYESQRHLHLSWEDREVELLWDLQTEYLAYARTEEGFICEKRWATNPPRTTGTELTATLPN